ncbi:hypothetical protein L484_023888 [Morus notabilis]|uniref:Uncharacterized protein n=1 Tax=Morus notabilis TaxID=981085 RepID=W9R582_9ROSA|nr:hypothetical protein L484_023888 [Morus notabilis]
MTSASITGPCNICNRVFAIARQLMEDAIEEHIPFMVNEYFDLMEDLKKCTKEQLAEVDESHKDMVEEMLHDPLRSMENIRSTDVEESIA